MDREDTKDLEEVEGPVAMLYGEMGKNTKSNGKWTGHILLVALVVPDKRRNRVCIETAIYRLLQSILTLGREDDPRDSLCIRALNVIGPKRQISRDSRIEGKT